jgi:lactoylglutathione lyase
MRLGSLYTLYLALPGDACYVELTVNEAADATWPRDMGSAHFAISVEDLDAVIARLEAEGIRPIIGPLHPADRPDVRVCFLQDPSGFKVELIDGGEFVPPRELLPTSLGGYDD